MCEYFRGSFPDNALRIQLSIPWLHKRVGVWFKVRVGPLLTSLDSVMHELSCFSQFLVFIGLLFDVCYGSFLNLLHWSFLGEPSRNTRGA